MNSLDTTSLNTYAVDVCLAKDRQYFKENWMGLVINHNYPQLKLKLSIFATISD